MRIVQKRHRDPQRVRPRHLCSLCGGELYPGALCYQLNGLVLCEGCLVPWVLGELAPFRREVRP